SRAGAAPANAGEVESLIGGRHDPAPGNRTGGHLKLIAQTAPITTYRAAPPGRPPSAKGREFSTAAGGAIPARAAPLRTSPGHVGFLHPSRCGLPQQPPLPRGVFFRPGRNPKTWHLN